MGAEQGPKGQQDNDRIRVQFIREAQSKSLTDEELREGNKPHFDSLSKAVLKSIPVVGPILSRVAAPVISKIALEQYIKRLRMFAEKEKNEPTEGLGEIQITFRKDPGSEESGKDLPEPSQPTDTNNDKQNTL